MIEYRSTPAPARPLILEEPLNVRTRTIPVGSKFELLVRHRLLEEGNEVHNAKKILSAICHKRCPSFCRVPVKQRGGKHSSTYGYGRLEA